MGDIEDDSSDSDSGILDAITSVIDKISSIINWFGDFFENLGQFFINLFIPTDEQWAEIEQNHLALKETFKSKIPFVNFFNDELSKFNIGIDTTDFLHIHFEGWNIDLGPIKINTPPVDFTSVRDAYEPYRIEIRSLLALIVYGLGAVYIVKYIIHYGKTQSMESSVKGGDSK